jgi:hypothetical protein
MLDYCDQVIEKRTGISRSTMALDMEALSEQTATAVNANQAAAHTKVEEYARNIAEHGGLKRIFAKCLKLTVKHQDRARTVRLRDGWVEVDPCAWNADMDVTINTGLGSGSRERDLTMLMGIAAKQEAIIMQLGPSNNVLGLDKLFDTYRKMVEATGMKPAEGYFPEITQEMMQQLAQAAASKVDPKVQAEQMRAQTEGQLAQLKAQTDERATQMEAQLEVRKMEMQAGIDQRSEQMKSEQEAKRTLFDQEMERAKAQRDTELQQIQLERQAQVEERQAQADIAVKERDAQWKAELERRKFEQETALAQQKFEFDKKLELLKLWAQSRATAQKQAGENGGSASPISDSELDDALLSMGAELPDTNTVSSPMHHLADSHTQLSQHLAHSHTQLSQAMTQGQAHNAQLAHGQMQLVQALARGQEEHGRMLASVLAEISRPKVNHVLRDEHQRVIGSRSETLQ